MSAFAGSRHGLRLTLNIEEYAHAKYLSGSGIRVLLHDPKEVPNMLGSSIIVTPGSHYLLVVEYSRVSLSILENLLVDQRLKHGDLIHP